jgi:hypothetical protein
MGEVIIPRVIISDNLTEESGQEKGVCDDILGFSISWTMGQQ